MLGKIVFAVFAALLSLKQHRSYSSALHKAKIRRENADTARLKAARENEQQQALGHRAKRIAGHFDTFKKSLLPAAIAYGLSIAFIYFYLEIQFFPSGLSIAESILFLFLAFGFGLFSIAFIVVGFISLIPAAIYSGVAQKNGKNNITLGILFFSVITPFIGYIFPYLISWLQKNENDFSKNKWLCWIFFENWITVFVIAHLLISLLLGILIAIVIPILIAKSKFKEVFLESLPLALAFGFFSIFLIPWALFYLENYGFLLLTVASLSGVSAWFALDLMTMAPSSINNLTTISVIEDASKKDSRFYVALLMLMTTPVLVICMDLWSEVSLSSKVFTRLGFRTELATVRAKGDALASLRDESARSGIQLNFCYEKDGSATVSPVDLLWHGMGEKSLLRVGNIEPKEKGKPRERGGELEANSKEIRLIRSTTTVCRDIEAQVFFRSHNHVPSSVDSLEEEMRGLLKSMLPDFGSDKEKIGPRWRLDQMIVTGHADSMRLSDDGNEALARRRAACVATQLVEKSLGIQRYPQDNFKLKFFGVGSRETTARACGAEQNGAQRIECEIANRKVTVRLMLACEQRVTNLGEWNASNLCWSQARRSADPGKQDSIQGSGNDRYAQSYLDAKSLCLKVP